MTAKMKQWTALAVVGALVILAGGWFLLVSPKRSHAASLRDEAASKERANAQLETELAALKAKQKDLPKQQAKLAAVAAKIPSNSAMPTLIRNLTAAADDAGVELVSLTPSPATAVAPAAGAAAGTAAAPAAAPGGAAVGTLMQIPVSLNVVGSYFQVAAYLDRLEGLTRAFRVTSLTMAPGNNPVKASSAQPSTDSGKILTASISGQVFQTSGATASTLPTGK